MIVLLVIAPLCWLPTRWLAPEFYDTPRRLLLLFGTGLLLTLWLAEWAVRGGVRQRRHPLDLPVAIFAGALLVSGVFGAYPRFTFASAAFVEDNTFLPWAISLLLYLLTRVYLPARADLLPLAIGWSVCGGLTAIIGLADLAGKWGMTAVPDRLAGCLTNPMLTGSYFALLVPLTLGTALAVERRALRALLLVCAVLILTALAFTLTRGAWAGLVLGLLLLAVWYFSMPGRCPVMRCSRQAWWITGVAVLALLAVCAGSAPLRQRWSSIANLRDATVQTRLLYMRGAGRMFLARPISGWGANTIAPVFPQFRPSTQLFEQGMPINESMISSLPHNLPLQIAAEMGLLGLIAFAWLLVVAGRVGRQVEHGDALGLGLMGMLTVYLGCTLFAWDILPTQLPFWVGLACLAALTPSSPPPAPMTPIRTPWPVLAALIVGCGTLVVSTGQLIAAVRYQQGVTEIARAGSVVATDPAESRHIIAAAIVTLRDGQGWTLAPDLHFDTQLFDAYQQQAAVARSAEDAATAETHMLEAGQAALAILDREWQMRRKMSLYYLTHGRFDDARRLLEPLDRFEPHSAEVQLRFALLASAQGDFAEAEQRATRAVALSPSSVEAYALLGYYQYALYDRHDPRGQALLSDALRNFDQAATTGKDLRKVFPTPALLDYTLALLAVQRTESALEIGRLLRGQPEFSTLCRRMRAAAPADEGQRLVQRLQSSPAHP